MLITVTATASAPQPPTKPPDQPTEIRLQIVDSRTHSPLKGRRVQITFSGADGQYQDASAVTGRTASDGVVVFEIKQPIRPVMDVFVWWAFPCSRPEAYSTQTVIEDGVIAQWPPTGIKKLDEWCTANSQATRFQRQPGKVIFMVHPMNRFVWAWYDTWK
jgi:hypothetical protein